MRGRCRCDGDDIDLVPDTLSRQLGKPLAPVADEVLDRDGLSVHIPQLAQALEESGKPWRRRLRCARVEREEAQSRDLPRLRRDRERRDEDAESKSSCKHRASDRHAATCRLNTAVILCQPSILRNLIWPLATRRDLLPN